MKPPLSSFFLAVPLLALAMVSGSSVLSAQALRIRDQVPPTAPTNLVVTATTPHSMSLAWDPSTDNSFRFTYIICCAESSVTVSNAVTSYTLEGLDSGDTYTVRVYAQDAAGNLSGPSNPVTVTLPGDLAAPTKPVVQVLDVGPTHVTLSWSSTDDKSPIWYTIYVNDQAVRTLNSTSATFVCSSVEAPTYCVPFDQDTTYMFTVRARDSDGNNSPFSDPLFVTTDPINPDDVLPPTQPMNITSDGGWPLTVRWDPSTDDLTPQSLIRYDVYVNGELQAVVIGKTVAELFDADFGTNVVEIIAVDTADNESLPGTITVSF